MGACHFWGKSDRHFEGESDRHPKGKSDRHPRGESDRHLEKSRSQKRARHLLRR